MHYWLTSLLEKVSRRRRIILYPSIHLWAQPYLYISFILFYWCKKKLKLQQLAKTKSKTDIQHPPMIGIRFWKIKIKQKCFIVSYSERLDAKRQKRQKRQKLCKYKLLHCTMNVQHCTEQCWHMVKNSYIVLLDIRPWNKNRVLCKCQRKLLAKIHLRISLKVLTSKTGGMTTVKL